MAAVCGDAYPEQYHWLPDKLPVVEARHVVKGE